MRTRELNSKPSHLKAEEGCGDHGGFELCVLDNLVHGALFFAQGGENKAFILAQAQISRGRVRVV